MNILQWEQRPELNRPALVAAFSGWNDAGEASSGAVRFLAGQWHAHSFASIDPEEFFDFTETRPLVRLDDGITRSIEWPSNLFTFAAAPNAPTDIVFLHGTEPQLKWRTFCEAVIECARAVDASMVLTLGALLADVPHTRPAPVSATTGDPNLLNRLGLEPSQYEGPTGIVGVLHDACAKASIESASLWASVPHYVSQTASPKATLALAERTARLLGVRVDTVELEIAGSAYEQQVSELVDDDEDMISYVTQLEENYDLERTKVNDIADEAAQFLRRQSE